MSPSLSLVLLPGVLCDAATWRPVVDRLDDTDWHVPAYPAADALGDIADAVLATAPDRFDLAGHSMGGYIALEIVRRAPDRVARLALLSTSPFADSDEARAGRLALVDKVAAGGFEDIAQMMARFVIPKTVENAAALREEFVAVARGTGEEAFMRHQRAVAARRDQTDTLGAIACPCLLIGAEDDKVTPIAGLEALADGIADAETVRLASGGHLLTWTRPDQVATALASWRDRPD